MTVTALLDVEDRVDVPAWLADYRSTRYHWRELQSENTPKSHPVFHRPIGNVEFSFDTDGRYWEGRADLGTDILLNLRSSLDETAFRDKIILAWTSLRCTHWLTQARSQYISNKDRPDFVLNVPRTIETAVGDAAGSVTFLADHFGAIDPQDFWAHALNTARIINPDCELTRLFIHRPQPMGNDRYRLRLFLVLAHMIADGLSNMTIKRDFIRMLNTPSEDLRQQIQKAISSHTLTATLPLPQEALYPRIKGSVARQRWYWLLTRILRHVRKPLPAAFISPLRRKTPSPPAPLPAKYTPVLNYDRCPVSTTAPLNARASLAATQRLHRLCRDVNASIGAGCFALVALIHMEMYEQQFPGIPLADRQPFVSGFPANPRAFFNHHIEPNSVMLAFNDGIIFPFLPSDLPLEKRLRLLIRQAHRQLLSFQKRRLKQTLGADDPPMTRAMVLQAVSCRGAERVLANAYINTVERANHLLKASRREVGKADVNPQGAYPARMNDSLSTCNISSLGKTDALLRPGVYDLDDCSQTFVADLIETRSCVRARDGEFLVGIGGDARGLWANVSVDTSLLDPVLVEVWKTKFQTILEEK